jgi:hypothetical protein
MQNYADVPNFHTRIHAMKSRLFSLRDYVRMIRDPATMPGQVSGIRDTIETKELIFRRQIEPVLPLVEAHEEYKPFFLASLRRYEMQNARILLARAAGRQTIPQWYDISPYATLDRKLLEQDPSPDEVRLLLARMYPGENFKAIPGYRQLIVHLNNCLARSLYRSAEYLSGPAAEAFREMMLKRMAVMTLIWSLRLSVHYHFPEEKIRLYMDRFQKSCGGGARCRVIPERKELDAYLEQKRKDTGREPSAAEIEHYLEQKHYAWIAHMFHRDFHSIYCVVAYLWLLHYQIRNLFRIIDGRRFGLAADAVIGRMICEA